MPEVMADMILRTCRVMRDYQLALDANILTIVATIMHLVLFTAPPIEKPPERNQETEAAIPNVGSSPCKSLIRSMRSTITPKMI